MLKLEGVRKSFGGNELISGVSFSLAPGEIVGLVGPSGSGKSVLLKLIGGVLQPDQGTIIFNGQTTDQVSVGFLFQEGALFDSMSVIQNVAFPLLAERSSGAHPAPTDYDNAMEQAYEILGDVGLSDAYLKLPGQLSGGMRRRVALARALVARPQLVLLDDPTGGLDPVAASVIMSLICELHQRDKPTIIMVSHDIRRLLPSITRVLALFDGSIRTDEQPGCLQEKADPLVLRFLATRYDFSQSPPCSS